MGISDFSEISYHGTILFNVIQIQWHLAFVTEFSGVPT